MFLIGLTAAWMIRWPWGVRYRRRWNATQPGTRSDPPGDRVLLVLAFVGLQVLPIVYLFTPWLDSADYELSDAVGWIGAATFAGALWLLWRSHVDLGANWSPTLQIREGHTLVTTGVFRFVRHPMYAAHWLWAVAQPLLLHNWVAGPAFLLVFLPLYRIRVPREEEMMVAQFGDDYRRYASGTGRILPRLGKRAR